MTAPLKWGTTIERGVALLGALRPLMGARAVGSLALASSSGNVTVPQNVLLFPIRPGTDPTGPAVAANDLDMRSPFRTAEQKIVGTGGTTIRVTSLLGGVAMNVPDLTRFVFWPIIPGIDRATVQAAGAFTGATTLDADSALRSAVLYEQPDRDDNVPDDLLRGMLGQPPAALLSWAGSAANVRKGNAITMREDRWMLTIVTARNEGSFFRSFSGLTLLDLAEALYQDRGTVDTALVSEPGIKINGRTRRLVLPGFSGHTLLFSTFMSVESLFLSKPAIMEDQSFDDWTLTTLKSPTMADETGAHPGPLDIEKTGTYPQP